MALVDASLAPGPLHVRCAVLPPLRAGQPVAATARGSRAGTGRCASTARCGGARCRTRSALDPDALGELDLEVDVEPGGRRPRAGRAARGARRAAGRPGPRADPVRRRPARRRPRRRPAVRGAGRRAAPRRARRRRGDHGDRPRVPALGRAGAVHRAGARLARCRGVRPAGRARRGARSLVAVGASSGAHLAAGLALAVSQLPRTASQIARAGPEPVLRQSAGRSPG